MYKNSDIKKINFNLVFIIALGISIVTSVIFIIATNGRALNSLLIPNPYYSFMDFYDSLFHCSNGLPYLKKGVIYPPFVYLIYGFFDLMIPKSITQQGGKVISNYINGQFVFSIYTMLTTLALVFIVYKNKAGNNIERFLFLISILFSAPFLFQMERANIIIVSLIFLMMFIFLKDSNKKYLREISLIFLAMSACIKIYPAIFGLLLLKQKRFRELFRFLIYCVLLSLVPLFFFGGLGQLKNMVNNLMGISNTFNNVGFGYKVNLSNTINMIFSLFGNNQGYVINISSAISIFIFLISIPVILLSKCYWKSVSLITLLMIAIPSFSWTYTMIFMLVPLMLFLDDKNEKKNIDLIYLILFISMFALFCFDCNNIFPWLPGAMHVSLGSFLQSIAVVVMMLMIIFSEMCYYIKKIKNQKNQNNNIGLEG